MTRTIINTTLLTALALLVGCGGKERGPAYGHQQEFRRQIADSVPVKEWGYSISDIRISDDGRKVLVVFTSPGGTNHTETVLEDDGFRRYKGSFISKERSEAGRAAYEAADAAYTSNRLNTIRATPSTIDTAVLRRPDIMSMLKAGSAEIVVTLPDR